MRIDPDTAPVVPSADEQKILVKQVHVEGARVYPEAALLALSGLNGPSELTLSDLRAMALKIVGHYRKHGYFLAHAYLPALDIEDGAVTIASIYGSYPLLRSRGHNLTAQLNVDAKAFRDRADATASHADKKARVAILSLNGDARDAFSGSTTYTLSWISGDIAIEGQAALASDAATARTDGRYDKLSFSAMRQQNLSGAIALHASING